MKQTIILLALLVCPFILSATTSWQRLDATLQKVRFFPQNGIVFAVGGNGCLLRSADKGRNWEQPKTGTYKSIRSIDFATPSIGIAVCDSGLILRTIDTGKTWYSAILPTQNFLSAVQFVSATVGFAGGLNSTLFKTSDAGRTWQPLAFPDSCTIGAISMTSPKAGVIVGSRSSIWATNDGGIHWERRTIQNLQSDNYYFRQCLRNSKGMMYICGVDTETNTGVLVDTDSTGALMAHSITVSNDITLSNDSLYAVDLLSGIAKVDIRTYNLTPIPIVDSTYPPVLQRITSFCFVDNLIGVAVGFDKRIYQTTTQGKDWILRSYLHFENNEPLATIFFADDTTGYVCGSNRFIYRTSNGGATWLPQEQNVVGAISVPFTPDVYFTSPKHGFGASNSIPNSFIKTTDGGRSYTGSYIQTGNLAKIRFLNDSMGICINQTLLSDNSSLGILQATKDGGSTWTKKFFAGGLGIVHYRNPSTILVGGAKRDESLMAKYRSLVYVSKDGGKNWDSVMMPLSGFLRECWMVNDTTIFLTGSTYTDYRSYGLVYRSINGGKSFEVFDSSSKYSVVTVRFNSEKYGYILYYDKLTRTLDGGNTWDTVARLSDFPGLSFDAMSLLPSGNVVIGTLSRALYRSSFDTLELVRVEEPPKDDASGAAPVWIRNPVPTPSNEVVRAEVLWLPNVAEDEITFDFLNLLGQKPSTPVSIRLTRGAPPVGAEGYRGGTVEVHPPANLPSGMYLLAIRAKGFSKAVPVIIAR